MSARRCPKCRVSMKQETVRGILIDRCADCKGAWYDWKEIESILNSKRDLIHYVPPESKFVYKGKALCPACGDSLTVLRENPVFAFDIDFCEKEHGIWLDALEFEKVKEVVKKSHYQFKKPKETASAVIQTQKDVAEVENRIESHLRREKYYETWVTWSLITANGLVFVWFYSQKKLASAIVNLGFIPDNFLHDPAGQGWMFFSALFLHGNLATLLGSLLFLFLLGKNLEIRMGSKFFLSLYLLGGTVGFIPDLFRREEAHLSHIGTGAVITALLGTHLILFAKNRYLIQVGNVFSGTTLRIVPQVYLPALLAFQGACFLIGVQGVTLRSHLVGFGVGILFGLIWSFFFNKTPARAVNSVSL